MKFCAVLRNHPKDAPGGAEYQSYLISRELARRGHECHYVAYQSGENETIEDDGIIVHRRDTSHSGVIQTLADINADVYYFRLAPDLPLLWRAKRRLNGVFAYNISRNIQCQPLFSGGPYDTSDSYLRSLTSTVRYAVYRYLLRTPDIIFTQTRHQKMQLESNHGLKSTVVGNGHPIPAQEIEKESPPVVLWLASLKEVKNPEKFIQLYEATKDLPAQFWIVGRPVNDTVYNMIKEKTARYDTLEYLGGCGILESNEYFKQASVYVHTGDREGFPNTFIQSWLHKTPVISFCTDPDSALAKNDIGAHCKSLEESESFLRELIDDEEYRIRMGEAARRYGIENHSIGTIVDTIERELGRFIEELPTTNIH